MKQLLVIILLVFSTLHSSAQVETNCYLNSDTIHNNFKFSRKNTIFKTMPSFDLDKMQKEDAEMEGEDVPYRFGKGFDVFYTLADGQWEDVEGGRLWSISFKSKGALSLNYIFDNFYLPEGANLYIENQDRTVLYGPVKPDALSKKYDSFLTDIIPGDQSTIYLFEPFENIGESTLVIKRVVHGYRGNTIDRNYGTIGASSICNNDVACIPPYENESNAVALILLANGIEWCSGSLLMNTNYTFEPYLLTAFHCIDSNNDGTLSVSEKEDAENWMFKFCFKKTSCNGNNITVSWTYNKADFCSAWYKTDFALLKLNSPVNQNNNLTWLGWDRTGSTPYGSVCIHHPAGDVMKISVDYDTATSVNFHGGFNNAWQVDFDYGITQYGSSGSPLISPLHKVIGQLYGGTHPTDTCDWTLRTFGKFSSSWSGNSHDSDRLSNWLDPINTGQTTIDSYQPFRIVGNSDLFTQEVYQINNLPPGWTVSWNFSSSYSYPSGLLQANTPQTNQCTLNNPNKAHVSGILIASLYKDSGSFFKSLSKYISTGNGFTGTYSQVDNFSVNPHNIPDTYFSDGDTFAVGPMCDVYIRSTCFPGSIITYSGANLKSWNYSLNGTYGVIHLKFPLKTTTQYLTIKAVDNTNGKIYEFYVNAIPSLSGKFSPTLDVNSNGEKINVILSIETENANMETVSCVPSMDAKWELKICNAITGNVMYEKLVEDWSQQIDTTGWPAGVYVINAQVGEQIMTQKVTIE